MRLRGPTAIVLTAALGAGASAPSAAWAHALAPSLLQVREIGPGRAEVMWKTPAVGVPDAALRPVLPADCRPLGQPVIRRVEAAVSARWEVECGSASLVGKRLSAEGLAASRTNVLILVTLADGRSIRAVLTADHPSCVVPGRERRVDVARSYALLGIEHILTGPDHLLFVLGLLLLIAHPRRLLWTLTAFTLGHSLTLSLAALGVVHVPTAPVEAAIAFSIFVLAVELARDPAAQRRSLLQSRPWAMAATFGLLHGLGFAGALAQAGLPDGQIPLALCSFNLGIELGQVAFVAAVLAVGAAARPLIPSRIAIRRLVPAYAIGSLAAFWLFERLAATLSAA
jgi:hydrogenase/urease accessory protein HupE